MFPNDSSSDIKPLFVTVCFDPPLNFPVRSPKLKSKKINVPQNFIDTLLIILPRHPYQLSSRLFKNPQFGFGMPVGH